MAPTVVAAALVILAAITVGCVALGPIRCLGRDPSPGHPTIDAQRAREDA